MRFIRFLTVYIIVAGGAVLLAPESMSKLSRWFADNPRYLRLEGDPRHGLGYLAGQRAAPSVTTALVAQVAISRPAPLRRF